MQRSPSVVDLSKFSKGGRLVNLSEIVKCDLGSRDREFVTRDL
jgi:hypothetical protein